MIGKILGNRYEIIEKIGGGGMSVVYKAKCNVLNRFVAVKVLRHELTSDPEFIEKFKQESLAAASLTHPNIVGIYDTGCEDDVYYIVMEYVKGETLKDYIKKRGNLSEEETIRISRQIAEALKHAHSNKIVHRDIKPHNILITEDGIIKVTDFGIARASTSSTINNTSNVIGSVHYFSPEQARGGYVDEKSDIYSLGVVMYEMVTGVVPFDADNHISVAMKHIQEKPLPPSRKVGGINVSEDLENIIMKCLEKHQSYRYQNIDELLTDLNGLSTPPTKEVAVIDGEPVDCPTIVMPKIEDSSENGNRLDDDNIIEVNLIDENSDRAFKTFFSDGYEETDDSDESKQKKRRKSKEDDDEPSGKPNYKITIAAILCALVVACVGGFIGFKAMFYVPEVQVPDLLGKSEEEGKKIIEDLGLVFNVRDRVYDDEHEEGQIIEQSVAEGTSLKEKSDTPIEVIVSKGVREIKVPNLVDNFEIDAAVILNDRELKEGKVSHEYSDTVAKGKIISQSPEKDTPAEPGDAVDYTVSDGPQIRYSVVPAVTGVDLATARGSIERSGFVFGRADEDYSETVESGIVIYQSYPAGQQAESGSVISVTVSLGPNPESGDEEKPDEKEEPAESGEGSENGEGDNPDGQQGTDSGDETQLKSYTLTIKLPEDKEKVSVVVQHVTADGRQIVYNQEVETSLKSILVPVEGTGTQKYEIYIDDKLYGNPVDVTFE